MAVATTHNQQRQQAQREAERRVSPQLQALLARYQQAGREPDDAERADVDRQFGAGTARWLLTQLHVAPLTPAEEVAKLQVQRAQQQATPGQEAELAQTEEALQAATEAKAQEKRTWHRPDEPALTLHDDRREGFDNPLLQTRGRAAYRSTETRTRTAPQKGLNLHAQRVHEEAHDEQLTAATSAHVVERKVQRSGDGKRVVQHTETATMHGDARPIAALAFAEEDAPREAEMRRRATVAGKLQSVDGRVVATEKEWSTREKAGEAAQQLVKGAFGDIVGDVQGASASATAGGAVAVGIAHGVTVTDNVATKATAFEGGLKYTTPELHFATLGEQLRGVAEVAFKAEALAEAKGQLKLNILARADGLELDVGGRGTGASGGAEAFAGLRGGVDAAVKLDWLKKPDYFRQLRDELTQFWQDTVGLPGGRIAAWALERANGTLFGEPGWANLLHAAASLEGNAGVGGAAAFEAAMSGERVRFVGRLKGVVGLGFGGRALVDASLLDGVRFLAVLTAKGGSAFADDLGLTAARLIEPARQRFLGLP